MNKNKTVKQNKLNNSKSKKKIPNKNKPNNNNTKTIKHKKSHKKIYRGGKVYGEGANGIVLGNPRIPCKDENFIDDNINSKHEVSKVLYNDDSEDEQETFKATNRLLNEKFTPDELVNLTNYVIIPSKLCSINWDEVNKHKNIYTPEWRDNRTISKYKEQIISEQGKHDLKKELNTISTKGQIISFLKSMLSIIKALNILHSKNIIHGDIKLQNIIIDNFGNFKIIDIDEMYDLNKDISGPDLFYDNFMYYIWPLASVYTYKFYKKTRLSTHINKEESSSFNVQNKNYFNDSIIPILNKINVHHFKDTFINEKNPSSESIDEIEQQLSQFSDEKQRIKLYKYIDRYSFGIMLLFILDKYLEIVGIRKNDIIVEELIAIIENCCFIKEFALYRDTDDIYRMYNRFVLSL